jgi:two-component system LytT family response regulator
MSLRAIVADDEELARRVLREYLAGEPGIDVVAECSDGFEVVKAAQELKPDLLFLDIQMPRLDGFEALELIDREIAVVFVTAFDQYAVRAFDAAAADYLLKPFTKDRFRSALKRARTKREQRPSTMAHELRHAARPTGEYLSRIVIRDGSKVHIMPVARLDYAEAQDDYVGLHSEGKTWLKQQTISSLEAGLDPARFLRLHRSWLVNVERIVRIEPNTKDTWVAVLRDGAQVPVSRGGYAKFREIVSEG